MKSTEFCYWLQGWFELNETIDHREGATKETLEVIKNHLAMVFYHDIDKSYPKQEQTPLQDIHDGGTPLRPFEGDTMVIDTFDMSMQPGRLPTSTEFDPNRRMRC